MRRDPIIAVVITLRLCLAMSVSEGQMSAGSIAVAGSFGSHSICPGSRSFSSSMIPTFPAFSAATRLGRSGLRR